MKLQNWVARLAEAGVPEPARDAQKLFDWAYRSGAKAAQPQTRDAPNAETLARFEAAIDARLARQPVSQIIGTRAFWRHDFQVTPDVLDPRPDTETLVEVALQAPFDRVLDLGTGSGCILCSLLVERVTATGLGTDLSQAALQVAEANAARVGVASRVEFVRSDWFSEVTGAFDLIVSNPPYISATAFEALMPEVKDWEPRAALTPGGDGLDAYRAICASAAVHLTAGGRLCLEIGYDQAEQVSALCAQAGLENVQVTADLNDKARVVCAQAKR